SHRGRERLLARLLFRGLLDGRHHRRGRVRQGRPLVENRPTVGLRVQRGHRRETGLVQRRFHRAYGDRLGRRVGRRKERRRRTRLGDALVAGGRYRFLTGRLRREHGRGLRLHHLLGNDRGGGGGRLAPGAAVGGEGVLDDLV